MIYKMMPRVHVQWHDVWLGALVTALLFTVGKFLIGIYIGKSGIASGFGAAASLVIVFLWVYYSAQIFLLGAEFTWVYARTLGSMQDVATAEHAAGEKAAAADQKAPTRSDPGRRDDVPAVLNTAVAGATADARSRAAGTRPASSIGDVGAGVALLLALRFALPRLLRRL
jgi:membrane protein